MSQTKNINMTPEIIMPVIKLSQYDVGRVIVLNLKDGSGAYSVPSGATVKLVGTKPSGLGFQVTGTVLGSTVTITTTNVMTDECGIAVAELSVEKEGLKLGSTNIRIDVERSPHPEGTTDGSAEEIIPALTLLLNEIEDDLETAAQDIVDMTALKEETESNALKSEGWADGKQGGEPVEDSSPYYHNNSKYYSEQSAAKALESEGWADGKQGGTPVGDSSPYYHNNSKYYSEQSAASAGEASGYATDAANAKTGAEAAEARATAIVAGCITIDAETSELIIYE
jgi:hypothetical protein